ncbi:MAG: sodium:proton antiporter, partial [Candidatus Aenigmatarchaeota archaeon]
VGLLRFPDFYTRTHAATVVSMGGMTLALLALIVKTFWNIYSVKILLIIIINLLTSPTSAHIMARSAYDVGVKPKVIKDELKNRR